MFTMHNSQPNYAVGRRDFLRRGAGLAVSGFALPPAWLPSSHAAERSTGSGGRAKSCVLVYLLGGPPHQDMFDLKPNAPAEVRGPFQPIATNVPGIEICEHLPLLATMADKYALVRSVSHDNNNHTPMIYYTLTGRNVDQPARDNDVSPPRREDFPHSGAVLAKFKPAPVGLPGFISIPELAVRSSTEGSFKRARTPLRGGGSGLLGARSEALQVNGRVGSAEAIPALQLPQEVSAERFERRTRLLSLLDGGGPRVSATEELAIIRQTAMTLTGTSSRGGLRAFKLDEEPPRMQARYGQHRFGQTMLLARRLVEAQVPMVAIHWNEMTICNGWDTHSDNFAGLKSELLPMLDQGLSALIEDLHQRGLLDETLILCFGEFGRTPKINGNAGRDHWGSCSTTLLAGGGIRGGQVHGASDKLAAYPITAPVDPIDIQATMYHLMGLEPHGTVFYDALQRPLSISDGNVIRALI